MFLASSALPSACIEPGLGSVIREHTGMTSTSSTPENLSAEESPEAFSVDPLNQKNVGSLLEVGI